MVWHTVERLTHDDRSVRCPEGVPWTFRWCWWRTRCWRCGEHMTARGAGHGRRRPPIMSLRGAGRRRSVFTYYLHSNLVVLVHPHIPLGAIVDCQPATDVHLVKTLLWFRVWVVSACDTDFSCKLFVDDKQLWAKLRLWNKMKFR